MHIDYTDESNLQWVSKQWKLAKQPVNQQGQLTSVRLVYTEGDNAPWQALIRSGSERDTYQQVDMQWNL